MAIKLEMYGGDTDYVKGMIIFMLWVNNDKNTQVSAQLAITKTSEKLGPKQYRNGSWDRLEGQDSSEDK